MSYYICVVPAYDSIYAEDEAILRDYIRVFTDIKNPNIYKVDESKLQEILSKYPGEEVVLQMDGVYMTDSDSESILELMQNDISSIHSQIRNVKKFLKFFKGKKAKLLKDAIDAFLKERVENPDFSIDEYDTEDILLEKINVNKYIKAYTKAFRGPKIEKLRRK